MFTTDHHEGTQLLPTNIEMPEKAVLKLCQPHLLRFPLFLQYCDWFGGLDFEHLT